MYTFNDWYEVVFVLPLGQEIHFKSVGSLEEAEDIKKEKESKNIKVKIEHWKIEKDIPRLMGGV